MLAKFGPSFLKGACNRTLKSKKQMFYKRVVSSSARTAGMTKTVTLPKSVNYKLPVVKSMRNRTDKTVR